MSKSNLTSQPTDSTSSCADSTENINSYNENGLTQLHEAVLNNDLAKFRQLIADGADIKIAASKDSSFGNIGITKGFTVLHIAVRMNNIELNREVVKNYKELINIGDQTGTYPVHIASLNNKVQEVELFCQNGADLKVKDNYAQTPLHLAANYSRLDVMRTLLIYKADPNALDNRKTSPMERLVNKSTPTKDDCVRTLLEFGAEVNKVDIRQESLLDKAIASQEVKFVELLVRYKADVNKVNALDNVPLTQALMFGGNKEIIKLLILNGADPLKENECGISPVSYAQSSFEGSTLRIGNIVNDAAIISKAILESRTETLNLSGLYTKVEDVKLVTEMIITCLREAESVSYEGLAKAIETYITTFLPQLFKDLKLEINREAKSAKIFMHSIVEQINEILTDPNILPHDFRDTLTVQKIAAKHDEIDKNSKFNEAGERLKHYMQTKGSTGMNIIAELMFVTKLSNNAKIHLLRDNILKLENCLVGDEIRKLLEATHEEFETINQSWLQLVSNQSSIQQQIEQVLAIEQSSIENNDSKLSGASNSDENIDIS